MISCVIPCLDERYELPALLRLLRSAARRERATGHAVDLEVIVVDGGSTDGTQLVAEAFPEVRWVASAPHRARQLNRGAQVARGDVLYFVHADSRPPLSCLRDIYEATRAGAQLGGYPFAFDSDSRLLRFNSAMTRVNVTATRGGDQGIFVTSELFDRLGGFPEDMSVMEEYGFLRAAQRLGVGYRLLRSGATLVSARKYEQRSWVRVQVANLYAMGCWRAGASTETIRRGYAWLLSWPSPPEGSSVLRRTYGPPDGD